LPDFTATEYLLNQSKQKHRIIRPTAYVANVASQWLAVLPHSTNDGKVTAVIRDVFSAYQQLHDSALGFFFYFDSDYRQDRIIIFYFTSIPCM